MSQDHERLSSPVVELQDSIRSPDTDKTDAMAGVIDEETPLIPQGGKDNRKGTIFSSVFNLMNTCVGAGTLSVAYAFSQGGLAVSGAVFVIIIVCSLLAALQMVDAKRHVDEMLGSDRSKVKVRVDSFPSLGEAAFGVGGKVCHVQLSRCIVFTQDIVVGCGLFNWIKLAPTLMMKKQSIANTYKFHLTYLLLSSFRMIKL